MNTGWRWSGIVTCWSTDPLELVAFGPVAADVESQHEVVRRLVRSLCVAQAVRHVDPASLEAVYESLHTGTLPRLDTSGFQILYHYSAREGVRNHISLVS